MLKTCSIGKTVLSVLCARFKSHICKLRHPPPTLRPRNPCICPCLSRRRRIVHKYPDCAHFLLVGRRSERLCRRLVDVNIIQSTSNRHKANINCNSFKEPTRNTGVDLKNRNKVIIGDSILLSTSARRNSPKEKCINLHILSLENSIRYKR